ncbi:MAG TPA: 3-isopropylmalate dehydrogenase [Dehalococcoidia bacterium]|nr:3-isopropylmalate dehydrogenase [Dehalococcoidia bacterium]
MQFKVAVLPGDGVGPEVTAEGVRTLEAIGERFGHQFEFRSGLVGGCAIDEQGTALPDETVKTCAWSDAVLFGAVGGPKWDDPQATVRPEQGIIGLRKRFQLFANLRPVKVFPQLMEASAIKPEVLRGTDILILRELTGGLYFGKPSRRWETSRGRKVVDTLTYTEQEMERIIRVGFESARIRRKHLTSVDKANVLTSSRLWREIAVEVSRDYPDVTLEHLLVDAAAMHLIRKPASFDVIVTENLFGDILTDEASMLAGSMGMLPSASLGETTRRRGKQIETRRFGLYEPIHGSAPDIAGRGVANPIAMILSVALMLRYSFGREQEAQAIESAVNAALDAGLRTADIAGRGAETLSTSAMGRAVIDRLG